MIANKKREIILLDILSTVNTLFKDHAVLKGGLVLRLLNSPRFTQDIDYVFTTRESRKSILPRICDALAQKEIQTTESKMNSRGLFLHVKNKEGVLAQVEISIEKRRSIPTQVISTAALARELQRPTELVTVMALETAFSNKIAAALERDAMRDFYDLSLYEPMTNLDVATLKQRLKTLTIKRSKPKKYTFAQAADLLEDKINKLTPKEIEQGLKSILAPKDRKGIGLVVKASILRVCRSLRG